MLQIFGWFVTFLKIIFIAILEKYFDWSQYPMKVISSIYHEICLMPSFMYYWDLDRLLVFFPIISNKIMRVVYLMLSTFIVK